MRFLLILGFLCLKLGAMEPFEEGNTGALRSGQQLLITDGRENIQLPEQLNYFWGCPR